MSYDILALAQDIYKEGFCILRDLLPREDLEACNEAFKPILNAHMDIIKSSPNRGPNRHYISLPLEPPFYNPRFFGNDHIMAILEQVLGEDFAMSQYATDTPLNESVYQDIHVDMPPLFHEDPEHLHPPPILAVNFPFIDITPAHGPFEVARGTHLIRKSEALKKIEEKEIPLEPLLMNAGDVLIRDIRCLHRGTPNRTDEPRVVAVIGVQRSWMWRREALLEDSPISRKTWDELSSREQKALRHFYRVHLK